MIGVGRPSSLICVTTIPYRINSPKVDKVLFAVSLDRQKATHHELYVNGLQRIVARLTRPVPTVDDQQYRCLWGP